MKSRLCLAKCVRVVLPALVILGLLPGCASEAPPMSPSFGLSGQAALHRIYRLGIGDKIKITVFGEDNLSGQVEVNAIGQVALPLAGEIPAKGLTVTEFRDGVARKLADGYLKNPKVTVEILNYRPIYVHGEVKNGGEFQYKPGLMLRDAIAMAGGFTYRADKSFAVVVRDAEPEGSLPMSSDVPVLPGDNIRITERFF
ncbi:MAG: polysaccharide biosynthesis/export family protein [Hyphomicrobium sp.]